MRGVSLWRCALLATWTFVSVPNRLFSSSLGPGGQRNKDRFAARVRYGTAKRELFRSRVEGSEDEADRRSRRSRRLIVEALLALMREKRYDRITVQEIIDRADVGRTTFYAQFRNKEDVLESEIERVLGLLHAEHLVTAAGPGRPTLTQRWIFSGIRDPLLTLPWCVGRRSSRITRRCTVSLRDRRRNSWPSSPHPEPRLAARDRRRVPGGGAPHPRPLVAGSRFRVYAGANGFILPTARVARCAGGVAAPSTLKRQGLSGGED